MKKNIITLSKLGKAFVYIFLKARIAIERQYQSKMTCPMMVILEKDCMSVPQMRLGVEE